LGDGLEKKLAILGIIAVIILILLLGILIIDWNSIFKTEDNELSVGLEVSENPFLWKIEGENPSYLFGSMHLSDERLLTLPDIVLDAIEESDAVYTEIELDQQSAIKSDELSRLPTSQTIYDLLPDDVEERVDSYLKTKGLTLSLFSSYKIWVVSSNLVLLDEIEYLYLNPSLDQYIWNLAVSYDKTTGGIETIEEQVGFFDIFTIDEQIEMLNDTLDDLEEYASKGETATDTMKDLYIEGDLDALQDFMFSSSEENVELYKKFEEILLVNRNENMTDRIDQLINENTETQYFFTIGAGHFYGDYGLITLLENKGYTVTRVQFADCETCDSGESKINDKCYEPYVTS